MKGTTNIGGSQACLLLRLVGYVSEEHADLELFHLAQLAKSGVLLMHQLVNTVWMRGFEGLVVSNPDGRFQLFSLYL